VFREDSTIDITSVRLLIGSFDTKTVTGKDILLALFRVVLLAVVWRLKVTDRLVSPILIQVRVQSFQVLQ
jgi:hypothetical protein